MPDPPRTEAEVAATLEGYRPEVAGTRQAREAARFLLFGPPLPLFFRPIYACLAAAAVALLPRWARRELRLPSLRPVEAVLVRPAGHLAVNAIRWGISINPLTSQNGPIPPSHRPPSAASPVGRQSWRSAGWRSAGWRRPCHVSPRQD